MTSDQKDEKLAQAYQVMADWLLPSRKPQRPMLAERWRVLDYFSGDEFDENFLPWPRGEVK